MISRSVEASLTRFNGSKTQLFFNAGTDGKRDAFVPREIKLKQPSVIFKSNTSHIEAALIKRLDPQHPTSHDTVEATEAF